MPYSIFAPSIALYFASVPSAIIDHNCILHTGIDPIIGSGGIPAIELVIGIYEVLGGCYPAAATRSTNGIVPSFEDIRVGITYIKYYFIIGIGIGSQKQVLIVVR